MPLHAGCELCDTTCVELNWILPVYRFAKKVNFFFEFFSLLS